MITASIYECVKFLFVSFMTDEFMFFVGGSFDVVETSKT